MSTVIGNNEITAITSLCTVREVVRGHSKSKSKSKSMQAGDACEL